MNFKRMLSRESLQHVGLKSKAKTLAFLMRI